MQASDRASGKTGVLVVNLGTPDAPTVPAVRRFLAEFLWDKRVIDYPRLPWWLILHGIILRVRPPKSTHAYAQIWTPQGSPLMVYSTAIQQALQMTLGANAVVALGMTYGRPSIATALRQLRDAGVRRIVVLPLYPQYSSTTTAPVFDRVDAELRTWNKPPPVRKIEHYYGEPAYLDALAQSIRVHWQAAGKKHLLFSFHGIPQRYVDNGDPYYAHCKATAESTAQRLQLSSQEWTMAFQSRVGREQWLAPYTDQLLGKFAKEGPKEVSVVCPAFATDCLETLEEIAIRNREDFLKAGGRQLDYIPCLNATPAHMELFAALVNVVDEPSVLL
jgi:protoporphyrin/coproporphyrin ferrochelatase